MPTVPAIIQFGSPGTTAVPQGRPTIQAPPVGLDLLSQEYLIEATDAQLVERLNTLFPDGKVHPAFAEMHVVEVYPEGEPGYLWKLQVTYMGRIRDKRFYQETNAAITQSSKENTLILATGYPLVPVNANVQEGAPVWIVSYLSEDAESPIDSVSLSYDDVGITLKTGYPSPPAPPDNKFATIDDPSYNYPSGWVLESRRREEVKNQAGSVAVVSVEDVWQYYHMVRP